MTTETTSDLRRIESLRLRGRWVLVIRDEGADVLIDWSRDRDTAYQAYARMLPWYTEDRDLRVLPPLEA